MLESELSGSSIGIMHNDNKHNEASKVQAYISTGSNSGKRKLNDDGRWWLPTDTLRVSRARWPTSVATRRGRTGRWSRDMDPWLVEDLIMKQSKHKEHWKHLYLNWGGSNDEEAQLRHPGGAGGEGDDGQHAGGGLADPGAEVEVPTRVHRPGETDVQPLGGAHDLHDDPEAGARHRHQGGTGEAKHEPERGGEHSMKRVKLVGPGHGAADGQGAGGGGGGALHRGGRHPKEHTDATKQQMKVSKWRWRPRIVKRDQLS